MRRLDDCARPTLGSGPLLVPKVMSLVADFAVAVVSVETAAPDIATNAVAAQTARNPALRLGIPCSLVEGISARSVRRNLVIVIASVVRLGHIIRVIAARAVITRAHGAAGLRNG